MEEFNLRILEETKELAKKLNALNSFFATETFYKLSRVEKDLLYDQNVHMTRYIQTLGKRLELYKVKFYD